MDQDTLTPAELSEIEEDIEMPGAASQASAPARSFSAPRAGQASKPAETQQDQSWNLELLLDVQLPVTVELGRTICDIRYILSLGESAIIELEKPANEPVDIYAGDRLVARGEVVVIDENFGVRITEIVDPKERLRNLV